MMEPSGKHSDGRLSLFQPILQERRLNEPMKGPDQILDVYSCKKTIQGIERFCREKINFHCLNIFPFNRFHHGVALNESVLLNEGSDRLQADLITGKA